MEKEGNTIGLWWLAVVVGIFTSLLYLLFLQVAPFMPTAGALADPYCRVRSQFDYTTTRPVTAGTTYNEDIFIGKDSSDTDAITKVKLTSTSNVTINSWTPPYGWSKEQNSYMVPNNINEGKLTQNYTDNNLVITISYTITDSNSGWIGADVGTGLDNAPDFQYSCGNPLVLQIPGSPPPPPPAPACQYNPAIPATDPACVAPPAPACQYNPAIPATDPACVAPPAPPAEPPAPTAFTPRDARLLATVLTGFVSYTIIKQFRYRY